MAFDEKQIEERINLTEAANLAISTEVGGVQVQNMLQLMEVAKMLAVSKQAVRKHFRGEPGMCLAVCIQAYEWRISPYALANKSYVVNDQLAYESQLIMAVINMRAPLKERLRYKFEGEGPDMKCTVSGHFKGEVEPLLYTSPAVKDIKPKNSPLWVSDPQQQLSYYSARAWARRYCPEVTLGIYAEDELDAAAIGPEHAKDVTPSAALAERLKAAAQTQADGFNHDKIQAALEHRPALPVESIAGSSEKEAVEARPTEAKQKPTRKKSDNKPAAAAAASERTTVAPDGDTADQEGHQPATAETRMGTGGERGPGLPPTEAEPAKTETTNEGRQAEEDAGDDSAALAPSSAYTDAAKTVDNFQKNIHEAADLNEFRAVGRKIIDEYEGLTEAERDALRGRFMSICLTEQAARDKKKRR